MKPIEKIFVYWAGIGLNPSVAATIKEYFDKELVLGIAYKESCISIEYFRDMNVYGRAFSEKEVERVIRGMAQLHSSITKLSPEGEIFMMVRVQIDKEESLDCLMCRPSEKESLDCLMYRPSEEETFQIAYEKGLDGNNPSRYPVEEEERGYFDAFIPAGIPFQAANEREWNESISIVVRNGIAHVFPCNPYDNLFDRGNSLYGFRFLF